MWYSTRLLLIFIYFVSISVLAGSAPRKKPALNTSIDAPTSLALDNKGHLYVVERNKDRILRIDLEDGAISTVAGIGQSNGEDCVRRDNIPAVKACLDFPTALTLNSDGDLFIGDIGGFVRQVSASTGIITTIYPKGPADEKGGLQGLTFDNDGNLFIADGDQVFELNTLSGAITLVAGTKGSGFSGDNSPPKNASFRFLSGVALEANGSLVVTDSGNCRVRRIENSKNVVSTIAVTDTVAQNGSCGEGMVGPIRTPSDPVLDSQGNIFFIEGAFDVVLRLDANTHEISAVAGTEEKGFKGDGGPANKALLNNPSGLAIDTDGNLYIAEYVNNRIRRVDGKTGIITTIAGNGLPHRVDVEE